MITRLDAHSARKISAGQVITDVASVVKELLENALDAHATTVTIRLYRHGIDKIVVDDDGDGIAMGDVFDRATGTLRAAATTPLLAHRATTKLRVRATTATATTDAAAVQRGAPCMASWSDGNETTATADGGDNDGDDDDDAMPLGFRGEALHSLAQLADVSVVTRHASTAPHSVEVRYDGDAGTSTLRVCDCGPTARQHNGTTVTVSHLFRSLPVRHKELLATARAQVLRAVQLVKQYAVSHTHVRLVLLHHERATAAPVHLVSLTGAGSLSRSVSDAYGGLCLTRMHDVEWHGVFGVARGLVSNAGEAAGRLRGDQQVFALDGRLVDLPRCAKAINDAYAQSLPPDVARRVYVAFFLQLRTPTSARYDVNLTPNKRTVLLADEDDYVADLYRVARDEFARAHETALPLTRHEQPSSQQQQQQSPQGDDVRGTLGVTALTPPRHSAAAAATLSSSTAYVLRVDDAAAATRRDAPPPLLRTHTGKSLDTFVTSFLYNDNDNNDDDHDTAAHARDAVAPSTPVTSTDDDDDDDGSDDDATTAAAMRKRARSSSSTSDNDDAPRVSSDTAAHAAASPPSPRAVVTLTDASCRTRELGAQRRCRFPAWSQLARDTTLRTHACTARTADDDNDDDDKHTNSSSGRDTVCARDFAPLQAQTDAELTMYFHKRHFSDLRVLGQFNHGFIVCALRDDIFVVDQHASDEKYNYEQLMRNYVAQPQPLVVPASVTMDAMEVDVAIAHAAALRAHGFDVARGQAPTTLCVRSVPTLPYDDVAASDVCELVQQLMQYQRITRPLRAVWHSMATKACRSSIMIGTPLSLPVMRRVVRRLGTLSQPWSCPHGRPTLRHLYTLRQPPSSSSQQQRSLPASR